jgi:hypothetical protein
MAKGDEKCPSREAMLHKIAKGEAFLAAGNTTPRTYEQLLEAY